MMSIKIVAMLHPYGSRLQETYLATIDIWSEPDNQHHGYRITLEGRGEALRGLVPKGCSGHRNLLGVLQSVLSDALEKHGDELGFNYITTEFDT